MNLTKPQIILSILCVILSGCSDSGSSGDSNPVSEPPVVTTGNMSDDGDTNSGADGDDGDENSSAMGIIPGDVCKNNQPIDGAVSLSDIHDLGIFSGDVTYQTGGGQCNLRQVINGETKTVLRFVYFDDRDIVQDRLDRYADRDLPNPPEVRTINGADYIVDDEILGAVAYLRFNYANGLVSSLRIIVNDTENNEQLSNQEIVAQADAMAKLVLEKASFEDRELPDPTDWFVCNENNLGIAGADPAALVSIIGADPATMEVSLRTSEISDQISCIARVETSGTDQDYVVRLDVWDLSALGFDPVDTFIENNAMHNPVRDTIDGRSVGVAIKESTFDTSGVLVVGPDNVTVTISVFVPEREEDQLGDLVRAVAAEMLPNLP